MDKSRLSEPPSITYIHHNIAGNLLLANYAVLPPSAKVLSVNFCVWGDWLGTTHHIGIVGNLQKYYSQNALF